MPSPAALRTVLTQPRKAALSGSSLEVLIVPLKIPVPGLEEPPTSQPRMAKTPVVQLLGIAVPAYTTTLGKVIYDYLFSGA